MKNKKIENLTKITKAKLLSSNQTYNGNFIKIITEKYLLPNNKIIERERIEKNKNKHSVIIIAITKENKYILVVQNRVNSIVSIEFPSGYIEKNENIKEASTRELLEETGYYSQNIEIIDNCYSSISIDSSIINIVIAKDCQKITNQNISENEYINYSEFTFKELIELINNNYIKSIGNKLAFYKYLNIVNSNKYINPKKKY